jgi:ATP-dependent Clp protease protease subunit
MVSLLQVYGDIGNLMETKEDEKKKCVDIPSMEDMHYYLFNQDFDQGSCGDAIRFILERNFIEKNRPKHMKMLINSYGGAVDAAFALIDTMKGSKIPIYTYGLGCIASCGLLTFIAGQKGKRFITRNTAILSHQFSWGSFGKEHELFATVKEFTNTHQRIIDHYKRCTGMKEADIKKYLLPPQDVWLTAKEAVKYGIADEIVEFY